MENTFNYTMNDPMGLIFAPFVKYGARDDKTRNDALPRVYGSLGIRISLQPRVEKCNSCGAVLLLSFIFFIESLISSY